jgi:predicted flap endonuclease-1-like 5' DNA nuclease
MSKIELAAEIVAYLIVAALLGFAFAWVLLGAMRRAKVTQSQDDGHSTSIEPEALTQQLAAREAEITALRQRLAALEQMPHSVAKEALSTQHYGEIPRFLEQIGIGATRSAEQVASDYDGATGNLFEEEAPPAPRAVLQRDDLKKVHGIGPGFERMLNKLGVHTYKQIALWRDEDLTRYARELHTFPDRLRRDEWVRSAREQHLLKYGERL